MAFQVKDPLYLNYLEFMKRFRGDIEIGNDFASVKSEKREFTFSVPHTQAGLDGLAAAKKDPMLLVPSALTFKKTTSSWAERGGVTFMTVTGRSLLPFTDSAAGVRIISGNDAALINDFSAAQCAGFLETPELKNSWAHWLTAANYKNQGEKSIRFYAAYINDAPVSGAIAVKTPGCLGVYGVATHPGHRKQGLGTMVLDQIMKESESGETVGLQVETESYAHQYYRRLGFQDIYTLRRFKNEN